jgi:hypothetical protein
MRTHGIACLFLLVSRIAIAEDRPAESLQVTLSAISDDILVGETIRLCVQVENIGSDTIQARELCVDGCEPDIQVLFSRGGHDFKRWRLGIYPDLELMRRTLQLIPRDSWRYAIRLLYSAEAPNGLPFEEPGDYRLKVRFPFWPPGPDAITWLESNSIRIRTKQPEGDDLRIWEKLRSDECLRFLQGGFGPYQEVKKDISDDVAHWLLGTPDSAYHPSMRWALGRYYDRLRRKDWDAPNPEDIENGKLYRKALGIVLRDPADSLGGDVRLFTRRVVVGFPEMTPLEQVFAVAEQQTGVPLSCDPALKTRRFSTLKIDQSLAQFMLGFTHRGDTKWVRDGRGYRLVPVMVPTEELQ